MLGEIGNGGVRHRVMGVDQIQTILLRNIDDFGGHAEIVGRILEQRIRGYVDFMNKNVGMKFAQTKRHGVADEMHFVAALCQGQSELGSDGAGAAVGGVTNHADFHSAVPKLIVQKGKTTASAGWRAKLINSFMR